MKNRLLLTLLLLTPGIIHSAVVFHAESNPMDDNRELYVFAKAVKSSAMLIITCRASIYNKPPLKEPFYLFDFAKLPYMPKDFREWDIKMRFDKGKPFDKTFYSLAGRWSLRDTDKDRAMMKSLFNKLKVSNEMFIQDHNFQYHTFSLVGSSKALDQMETECQKKMEKRNRENTK